MKNNRYITIILSSLLALAVFSAIVVRYAEPLNDGDIWFHLAYGRYMLENNTLIPDHTVFSWTATQNSTLYCTWLSDIVFTLLFKAGGLNMLYAFRFLVIFIFIALAFSFSRGSPPGLLPLLLLVCVLGLMMSYAGLRIKSEIFSFLFMAVMVWTWLSIKRKHGYSPRLPYLLPAVTLLWVNSHGGFIFGMGFLGLAIAGEWINRVSGSSAKLDDRTWNSLIISTALSALALLMTPYGWSYLSQLLNDLILNPAELKWHMKTIQEYWSVFNSTMSAFHFIDCLVIASIILATLFAVQSKRKRTDWSLVLVNVLFMLLYVKFLRTTYFWGIVFTFTTMYLLGEFLREGFSLPIKAPVKAALQGVCLALLLFMAARMVYNNFCSPNIGFNLKYDSPVHEANFIRTHLQGMRMGNDYYVGSYFMWSLHPAQKVFIDARYFPYKNWYQEYIVFEQNVDQKNTAAFLKKYPCDFWCISYGSRVITYFVSSPEWKALYYGPAACIFVSTRFNTSLLKPSASESIYKTNLFNAYDIAKSAATAGDVEIAGNLAERMNPCFLCGRQKETAINARLNVGNYLTGRKEYYKAISIYSGALSLDNSGAPAGWLLGRGKPSDIATLHDNLGYALLSTNQAGDALVEFETALSMNPESPNALKYLPFLRDGMAKIDASISRLKSILAGRPGDIRILQALVVQCAMRAKYDDALGYLGKEQSLQPGNPEISYNMACIYAKQKNAGMSLRSLDQAVQKGFNNWALLGSDHDLDNVRDEPAFKKLMAGH